jgi:E3 ubiquitin-protein ligase HUWE1
LIPNGRNIVVTDETKGEYIKLIAHHRMTSAIRAQIDSFLEGFYDLVPPELISLFSPTELELLICGLPDVDVDDLAAHTDYHQYREVDEIIVWFWDVLRGFSREERALFLQFVTGTSKVSYATEFDASHSINSMSTSAGSIGRLCKSSRYAWSATIFHPPCSRQYKFTSYSSYLLQSGFHSF